MQSLYVQAHDSVEWEKVRDHFLDQGATPPSKYIINGAVWELSSDYADRIIDLIRRGTTQFKVRVFLDVSLPAATDVAI